MALVLEAPVTGLDLDRIEDVAKRCAAEGFVVEASPRVLIALAARLRSAEARVRRAEEERAAAVRAEREAWVVALDELVVRRAIRVGLVAATDLAHVIKVRTGVQPPPPRDHSRDEG